VARSGVRVVVFILLMVAGALLVLASMPSKKDRL
jgi:hypothetical protein